MAKKTTTTTPAKTGAIIDPETGREVQAGPAAQALARARWLSNPNLRVEDLKGEARKRYDFLMNAQPGDVYDGPVKERVS